MRLVVWSHLAVRMVSVSDPLSMTIRILKGWCCTKSKSVPKGTMILIGVATLMPIFRADLSLRWDGCFQPRHPPQWPNILLCGMLGEESTEMDQGPAAPIGAMGLGQIWLISLVLVKHSYRFLPIILPLLDVLGLATS